LPYQSGAFTAGTSGSFNSETSGATARKRFTT
jgi:hypothetical protein